MNWSTLTDFLTLPRVGLLYDIAGAGILACGALTGKNRAGEVELFWKSETISRNIEANRCEAIVGLGLLIFGFVMQFFAGTPFEHYTSLRIVLTLALVTVVTVYLVYLRWHS